MNSQVTFLIRRNPSFHYEFQRHVCDRNFLRDTFNIFELTCLTMLRLCPCQFLYAFLVAYRITDLTFMPSSMAATRQNTFSSMFSTLSLGVRLSPNTVKHYSFSS